MKFLVAVDCEGTACGAGHPDMPLSQSKQADFIRLQATKEANAAVISLFDNGAENVIVWDNHGLGVNLEYELLDERCDILLGSSAKPRFFLLDNSFTGVLLIGYHAKSNTIDSAMAHTYSGGTFHCMKINGSEVGEIALDAALCGERGVPVIFVSSDDKGIHEAKILLPWIETAITKHSYGQNFVLSKHPTKSTQEIYTNTAAAVKNLNRMKIFEFTKPLHYEVQFKRINQVEKALMEDRLFSRVDGYTLIKNVKKISDIF
ncbi:MAG: hypothetical protein A2096_17570 [Spirochaetes bacterium GWF1_41_5]|nr:MAG: hypothetical protein A2096_17570 [Spirochaetes bacterium GWF1_41_5]